MPPDRGSTSFTCNPGRSIVAGEIGPRRRRADPRRVPLSSSGKGHSCPVVNTSQSRTDEKGLQDGANDVLSVCNDVLYLGNIEAVGQEIRSTFFPRVGVLSCPFKVAIPRRECLMSET